MSEASEELRLAYGRLGGVRRDGLRIFLGVPYAGSTAGGGRFAPPSAVAPWAGVRDACDFGPACPQPPIRENLVISPEVERAMFALHDEPQDEDCLSLNVWAPAGDGPPRPVMVSLHGGAFKSGSGSARTSPWFDGARLATGADVVVVTVNHRIGVLGHLALPELPGSGNAGLLDLVAALAWIRDNIALFGGDPERVTVFGESGGGGKAMALLTMRAARGLLHRAASQSGTLEWLTATQAADLAEAVQSELGMRGLADLRAVAVDELVGAALAVTRRGLRFAPVIDGRVIEGTVVQSLSAGAGAGVPLVIGATRDEASAFLGPEAGPARVAEVTETMFRAPALAAAVAQRHHARVWVYEFAWPTPALQGRLGAAHGVDVAFPFDNTELHPATAGCASAARLAPRVRDAWAAQAAHGDPNHPGFPEWPEYGESGATLVIDEPPALQWRPEAPLSDRRD